MRFYFSCGNARSHNQRLYIHIHNRYNLLCLYSRLLVMLLRGFCAFVYVATCFLREKKC